MSPGISLLAARGVQDKWIMLEKGDDKGISFFNQVFKKHSGFSQTVEKQYMQGAPKANSHSRITVTKNGDMLGHVYLTVDDGAQSIDVQDWSQLVESVEIYIGGTLIDKHTIEFMESAAVDLLANNQSKSSNGPHPGASSSSYFLPFRFWFCEHPMHALPICAIAQEVELIIRWGANAASYNFECHSCMYFLDNEEREIMASQEHNILITQLQSVPASNERSQECVFSHPVKAIFTCNTNVNSPYKQRNNRLKLQVNGEDLTPFKWAKPNFVEISSYYHTEFVTSPDIFLYAFCMTTNLKQPTGHLNFSRVASFKIVSESLDLTDTIYALSLNILNVRGGVAAVRYAN